MRYVAVAEPDYAARYAPDGLTPRNFHQVPFIAFNRKDSLQMEFVSSAMRLKRVALKQLCVPSSEGQVRAVLAGWGVSVVPELQVALFWHCWNLESAVLDALTKALTTASALALDAVSPSSAG
jgi:LysR family transcriptional regulator (chromosome initiation inhibitor)